MSGIASLADLRARLADLPEGDNSAAAAIAERQSRLTKPLGSLGRLEELVAWLGRWQGRETPRLDEVSVLVFAGNHGVVARGVSAYPASVTVQMVANFERGGAAINQICKSVGASLRVIPLNLDAPTADFTEREAMTEAEFVEAVAAGYDAVPARADLLCLGEMGIGNTTSASALAAALLGGGGERWAGRGTGLDDAGLARKRAVIDAGLTRHKTHHVDPLAASMIFGGRELAAILGATLAARRHGIPVLLDGFVATAAAAPLARLKPGALDHAQVAHGSAPSSACGPSSTSTCGSAKARVPRYPSRFSEPRLPATSAWPPSMRPASMNAAEMLRQRLSELAAAFALLTRLPVHRLSLPRLTVPAEAVWAYPIVGAAVGAIGGAVYWFTHSLSCPPALAALCALVAMILATGALHEDGLADFADGLAGDTKERSLSIMRDHQIGTYGVLALMLSLAMRTTAIALIAEPRAVLAALIAADAASRLSVVLIMVALPPARRDGLSASIGSPTAGLAAVALGVTFVIAWLLQGFGVALLLILSAIVSAIVLGRVALQRLGGQTGDVLGASSQICECLALILLVVA
jgi:nicotinate-nucleotide--dimethylbenzimidazole phosphoribosyltransferase